jgi:RimJ/RimL family protein N-acetyltransferase
MRYRDILLESLQGPRRIQDLSDYFSGLNAQEDLEAGDEPFDLNAPDEAHHRYVRENYLFGDCAVFAVALHRMTGWPIFQIRSRDSYHVFLQAPKGRLVDASGYTTLAKIRRVHRLAPEAVPQPVSAADLIDNLDEDSLSDPWHEVRMAEFYIRQLQIPPFNRLTEGRVALSSVEQLMAWAESIGVYAEVYEHSDEIDLTELERAENAPKGRGALFMRALCAYADKKQKPVWLATISWNDRLERYYRGFGFVDHGRAEGGDLTMVRQPKARLSESADAPPARTIRTIVKDGIEYRLIEDYIDLERVGGYVRVYRVEAWHDGRKVGHADFDERDRAWGVWVEGGYRRRGIATAMYDLMGEHLGKPVEPASSAQTDAAKAFWADRRAKARLSEAQALSSEAMIDAFYDALEQSDLYGKISVSLHPHGGDVVELSLIRTEPTLRGQGLANQAMALLTDQADRFEVILTLGVADDADGRQGGLTSEQLWQWYHGWGFEGGMSMKRYPEEPR